jgi:hypothetical protein
MYALSERQACGLAGVAVSSYRYQTQCPQRDEVLRTRLTALAQEHPRYGTPRLCFLLRREAAYNHKRVERIYGEAGLSLRRKKRKRLMGRFFSFTSALSITALGTAMMERNSLSNACPDLAHRTWLGSQPGSLADRRNA